MDKELILSIYRKIKQVPDYNKVLDFVEFDEDSCNGYIKYNTEVIELKRFLQMV